MVFRSVGFFFTQTLALLTRERLWHTRGALFGGSRVPPKKFFTSLKFLFKRSTFFIFSVNKKLTVRFKCIFTSIGLIIIFVFDSERSV